MPNQCLVAETSRDFACDSRVTSSVLCWVRAASGPFLENNLFPLKEGLRWVFANDLKWVQSG